MRAGSEAKAFAVASGLLEATGATLRSGDFDAFARCFHLPNTLATIGGIRRLSNQQEMKQAFDEIRAHYDALDLGLLDRWIAAALFDGPDLIRSCHVTRFIDRGGAVTRPTVAALGRLERRDGGDWRISGTQYSVHQDSDYGKALLGEAKLIDAASAASTAAEAVFQSVLDKVTTAYLEDRSDILLNMVQFPLFVQGSRSTQVMTAPEDLLPDFRRYRTQFLVHRVTVVVRRVTHAEQVGNRRIQGGYRTHILSGEQLVVPSYDSAMTLEQGEDLNWRMTSVIHPMGHLTLDAKTADARDAGQSEGGAT
ncbi:hypothetical protein [Antarctobacter jejuensis]|uniref:hypothetical protein n=1 Tax=Antarctobacter jejuensis TaxID=1439938 RepID=UPI003FD0BC90